MNEYLTLAFYWKNRNETLDDCVQKVIHTIEVLHESGITQWYLTDRPKKKGIENDPINVSQSSIRDILYSGQIKDNGQTLSELGSSIILKSDANYSKSNILSIHCGAFGDTTPNNVLVKFLVTLDEIYKIDYIFLKDRICEIWSPEYGKISHDALNETIMSFRNL